MSQPEGGAKPRIGELLMSRGLISNDQLNEALEQQRTEGGRLGDIILSRRWVTTVKFYDALTDHFRRGRMGDLLLERELITEHQLNEILEAQKQWGTRFGDIILAKGYVKPFFLSQVLAEHFDKPNIDMLKDKLDQRLVDRDSLSTYSENLFVPWRRENGLLKVAVVDVTPELLEIVDAVVGEPFDFVITAKFEFSWRLQEIGNQYYSRSEERRVGEVWMLCVGR